MQRPGSKPHSSSNVIARLEPRRWAFLGAGLAGLAGSTVAPGALAATAAATAGASLIGVGALVSALRARRLRRGRAALAVLTDFIAEDNAPGYVTDAEGGIVFQNLAASDRFGDRPGATLVSVLSGLVGTPSALLFRLRMRAEKEGVAHEDAVVRGGHIRVSAHRIDGRRMLWRLVDLTTAEAGEFALPMMRVTPSGTVRDMNAAMRALVGDRAMAIEDIVLDLPVRPGETHQVATPEGIRSLPLLEIANGPTRSEIYVLPDGLTPAPPEWSLLDALPVPLLKIAVTGEVLQSNRLARNLLEIERGGRPNLSDLVTGLGRSVGEWLADVAGGRGVARPEVVRASRPMTEVFLQITLGLVEDEDGTYLVAVLHDATELKTLEAQFVQSQKMQAIGQLAGGVAHDFNNLLTAISGHCDLLLLKRDPGDPDYADLEQINQNANRAASLVSQLLAFSRKQNLKPQLLDLRDTLSDLGHLLNRLVGEKVNLSLVHDSGLKMVRADKRQLEQVLMNLVVNARDAMPDGGTITIETAMRTLTAPYRRDRAVVTPGDYVVVKVTDAGVGIPADKLPKIFEPFFTTKRTGEGTGLGLSTAYGIIKQTGGFIFADSVPGTGTTFTIFLPAHDRPVLELVAPPAADQKPQSTQSDGVVLLVEDEAPVRAFASRALRLRGFTVVEAENAEEALSKLEDEDLAVDVFVTDVIMPGMDGPSWVSKALERRPGTRVVFVSGYAEESLSDNRAKIPNSVFLPKPFSLSDLTSTVQAQMH